MRAARLLIENFHGEDEIARALEEDLSRDDREGIARSIALNLDKVPDAAARRRLAEGVIAKAKKSSEYASYAKNLKSSKDESVSRLAKQELQ
jgi:hypothetical protein